MCYLLLRIGFGCSSLRGEESTVGRLLNVVVLIPFHRNHLPNNDIPTEKSQQLAIKLLTFIRAGQTQQTNLFFY